MSCFDNIEEFREEKRYLSKENTLGVRTMYSDLWKEYINRYGVQTTYYPHGYKIKTQDDFIYGEDATEPFLEPKIINMIVEYQTDAILLSKFGLESTADLTAVVAITDYQTIFGIGKEPKAGDVIELTEAAWETSDMSLADQNQDTLYSNFNVITDIESLNIPIISGGIIEEVILAPVKRTISEDLLSYSIPMYSVNPPVTSNSYPIENGLIPISGHVEVFEHLKIPLSGDTYFIPLYSPVEDIYVPTTDSLFFNYDIVDLNGEDIVQVGYLPFEYDGSKIYASLYQYVSETPVPPIVTVPASNPENIELDTKHILCKSLDNEYAYSITLELSTVYGAKYIRHPQLFEITEVRYQDYSQSGLNFAQGHYVWFIHAKRFDYSFEPNAPKEGDMDQVYDNSFFGTLSTFGNDPAPEKVYPQEVEEASKEVWDYEEKGTDTGPYGYY